MATYITTLPQSTDNIKTITLHDLIQILPDKITFPINVWLAGKIVAYGIASGNLMFLMEKDTAPTVEEKEYFNSLVSNLGIYATITNSWRDKTYSALQLYTNGILMLDKTTFSYKILPARRPILPIITVTDLLAKLPETIEWQQTMYLTGGLTRNG